MVPIRELNLTFPGTGRISLRTYFFMVFVMGTKPVWGPQIQLLLKRSSRRRQRQNKRVWVKRIKLSVSDGIGPNCPLSSAEASSCFQNKSQRNYHTPRYESLWIKYMRQANTPTAQETGRLQREAKSGSNPHPRERVSWWKNTIP